MLTSYAAWVFYHFTSVAPTVKFAASPGYDGRGKVDPTRNI